MSYFEDQEDVWFEHDCQGDISDVDPYDPDWRPTPTPEIDKPAWKPTAKSKWRSRGEKRNAQRRRAREREKLKASGKASA